MRGKFLTQKIVLDELKQRLENKESVREIVNSVRVEKGKLILEDMKIATMGRQNRIIDQKIGELVASARVCRSHRD